MNDPYQTMGISRDASKRQIKSFYRRLAKELHPDKGGDSERMQELSRAYSILSDPLRRKLYDDGAGDMAENYDKALEQVFTKVIEVALRKYGPQSLKSGFDNEISQSIRKAESALLDVKKDIKSMQEASDRVGEGDDFGTTAARDMFSRIIAGMTQQKQELKFQVELMKRVKEAGIAMEYREDKEERQMYYSTASTTAGWF